MRLVCRRCGRRYAVGSAMCPGCTSTDHEKEDDVMAKTTRHGGATDKTVSTEEGERPSDTKTSSPSTGKPATSSAPSKRASRPRARTTARRSSQGRTGRSTARSTGGSTRETT